MPVKIARSVCSTIVRAARAAGSHPRLASVLQQGRKSANICVSLGVIRAIPVKMPDRCRTLVPNCGDVDSPVPPSASEHRAHIPLDYHTFSHECPSMDDVASTRRGEENGLKCQTGSRGYPVPHFFGKMLSRRCWEGAMRTRGLVLVVAVIALSALCDQSLAQNASSTAS